MLRWSALFLGVALFAGACSSGSGRATPAPTPTTPVSARTDATTTSTPASPTSSAASVPAQRYEPRLPLAIQEAAATTTGGRLYVVGGYDTARNSSATTFVFDGSAWSPGPPLPIAINHPGAATINGTVYVVGGFTPAGATNRVFELTNGATSWRELAPMRRARGALSLVAVGTRLYAICGRDGSAQIAVPETYEPQTNTWTDLAAMPQPRNHVAGFVDRASVCVAGGRTPATSGAIDCLDTGRGVWRSPAVLPVATSGAAASVINGVTFVAGGEPSTETRLVDVVQRLATGTWTTEPMLVPRHGTAFAVYRGRLWMCGGATAAGFHAVSTCTSLGI
jgi:N-acetylneuraminic acid mutarotase